MTEHDDFARELRAVVDETIPVRHIGGPAALAAVKRRARKRSFRSTLGTSACVALVGLGVVSALGLGTVRTPAPSGGTEVMVHPYEGGAITEEHYKGIVEYVAGCVRAEGFPAGPVEKRIDGVTYGYQYDVETDDDAMYAATKACEDEVNLMEAEVAFSTQTRLRDVDREVAFAEFTECMVHEGVVVTESDDLAAVLAKSQAAVAAGADDHWVTLCLDGYSPRLYG
ncbi:hypothetical protein ACFRCR_16455 [Oerskovia sp. NPDC056781]|uniref:hypothetical protein n=1 Tax=Oerskovia sp. NPDC056781 TaxID=3345942 RepID=UPI00366E9A1C